MVAFRSRQIDLRTLGDKIIKLCGRRSMEGGVQHLIAATTIDVSFRWQKPLKTGAVAEGSQFSGKLA